MRFRFGAFLLACAGITFLLAQLPTNSTGGGGGGVTAADVVLTDTYANLPAAGTAGRLFYATDSIYQARDDGSNWIHYWPPIGKVTVPDSDDFTWVNQGGASIVTSRGGIYLLGPATTGDEMRILKKSAPTPPYTITVAVIGQRSGGSGMYGIGFRQSSDGKLHSLHTGGQNDFALSSSKWTDESTFVSNYVTWATDAVVGRIPRVLRIQDNSTNRICSASWDGYNFQTFHTVSRTDHLTADEVFIGVNTVVNDADVAGWYVSWVEE